MLADEFGDGAPVPMLPGSWGPDLVGVAGDGGGVRDGLVRDANNYEQQEQASQQILSS